MSSMKSSMKEKWKNLSETMKIISTVISSTLIIGGTLSTGVVWMNNTVSGISDKIDRAVQAAEDAKKNADAIEKNRKAIEEIRVSYTPLEEHLEHEKFIITQIDLEIDETMQRVAEGKYVGTRYVNTLKYYYDTFDFLTSKQKSMIETIIRYYDRQEMRNKNNFSE